MGTIEELNNKLDKLIDEQDKGSNKKKREFKLPWSIRMQQGKLNKKNFAIVLFIRTSGATQIKMMPIEEDTIVFEDKIYSASADFVLKYKKLPLIIIKEWDMEPMKPGEEFAKASLKGTLTAAQQLILTKMKMEAIKPKMQFNMGVILVILLVLGGGYFALSSMGVI